jgi:hypothetical protein
LPSCRKHYRFDIDYPNQNKIVHSFKISWAACFALATDALDNNPSLPTQSPTMYKFSISHEMYIDNNNIGAYKTIITSYELKAKQDTANIAKKRLSEIDEKIESTGSKDWKYSLSFRCFLLCLF